MLLRPALLLAALLGLASPALAADPLPTSPPVIDLDAVTKTADDVRFKDLVMQGDHARLAGRVTDAVIAYAAALRIRMDPLVAGRLGVLLANGEPDVDRASIGRPDSAKRAADSAASIQ